MTSGVWDNYMPLFQTNLFGLENSDLGGSITTPRSQLLVDIPVVKFVLHDSSVSPHEMKHNKTISHVHSSLEIIYIYIHIILSADSLKILLCLPGWKNHDQGDAHWGRWPLSTT